MSLYQYQPSCTRQVSSHRVLYLSFLSTYNMFTIQLLVIEACLKGAIGFFQFCHSKYLSDVIKNIFNSISLIIRKIFLVNKYKKMSFGENKSLVFDGINSHIFPSKFCHLRSQIPFQQRNGEHQSVGGGTSESEESFGKSFPFLFSAKYFDKNTECFLSCTFSFLNAMKFEDSKHLERYIFHYFL